MKMFSFSITDENKNKLSELAKKSKLSMSQIINSLISKISNTENIENENNKKIVSQSGVDNKIKIVKVRINESEYLALKKIASNEFLNVNRYIKFLISQKIYNDNNPTNSQINEIDSLRKDLLKIGVNINNIAKKINGNDYVSKDLLNLLTQSLKDIQKENNTIKLKINSFTSINKDRF